MKKVKILNLVILIGLITIFCASTVFPSSNSVMTATWVSGFRPHGAYVDEVVFKVYASTDVDQTMLDLQNGVIDAYDEHIQDTYVPSLTSNPDIAVNNYLIPIYRHNSLNCDLFPTNITNFRRAIAFGMDKYKANTDVTGGIGAPLDSYISPVATEWEVESAMANHFYDKDIISGNASLEAAGFKNLDNDGWREYDTNGNGQWDAGVDIDNVTCNIGASLGWNPSIICAQIAVDGLNEMGINSTVVEMDFSFLIDEFMAGNINSICFSWSTSPINPPKDLFDFFRSGEIYHEMFYHLNNATIDAALDDMMAATTLAEAKTKAAVAIEYLVYEQPMIVCFNDARTYAYRIDKFEGFSNFSGYGCIGSSYGNNPYAFTKAHLKTSEGGPYGGTFRCSFTEGWQTTNPIVATQRYSLKVFDYIYEGLWQHDPYTWDPIPALAYDWTIEATTAGGGLQDGQNFTFQLYTNATWHDGQPVTSADVKYCYENIWPTSPEYSMYLTNIYKVEAPDAYTVNIYSNQTGYFEWGRATGNFYVLPKHVWENHGPDFDNWVPSTTADMVGSGPYKWNTYVPGEYTSLIRHPDWHFAVSRDLTTTTPTTTPPTTIPTTMPATSEPTTSKPSTTPTTPTTSEPTSSKPSASDGDSITPSFELFSTVVVISGIAIIYIRRRRK
ncbi:MAG: ABC transporter substrate-binding protein [Candidatus Hermodarchaeota archaeon]